ncbi:MAG: TetR/AcrR family transcriptional regulator [Paludibacter sp.]|nr:TetR/AcrR family transcriptional regulator [Bacteroidales bacterium]MCM1068391.1 TetR/AcrR family transcriptional regulator [Prevotella sp.]MCM1354753.1 TetR/AcrR family transcriptional regulator [Bacteroides sp.]MCM1442162.1 TetR/AcrR family transcriptional regulator [Muribaculum sp.]MCM1482417.1 TetR/AcrR family transcriptional regulator [Paludibacter sp.]
MSTTELESRIMQAAERLFLERGFAQTSTTDIARESGCTQALVHYYYRTKERLFINIFTSKLELLLNTAESYKYDGDFFGFMRHMADTYFTMLLSNRQLPFLLINELVSNRERINLIREQIIENTQRQQMYRKLDNIVKAEIEKGTIRPIETYNLLLDAVSLIAMVFITLPMYTDLLQCNEEETNAYITSRKEEIVLLLTRGLTPEETT